MRFVALLYNVSGSTIEKYIHYFGNKSLLVGLDSDDIETQKILTSLNVKSVFTKNWKDMTIKAVELFSADTVMFIDNHIDIINVSSMLTDIKNAREAGAKCISVRSSPARSLFCAVDTDSMLKIHFPICNPHFIYNYFRRTYALSTKDVHIINYKQDNSFIQCNSQLPKFSDGRANIVTIDILVPMYRVNVDFVKRLTQLSVPHDASVRICVRIDNTISPTVSQQVMLLEKNYNNVYFSFNETNLGASETRNRLFHECLSEYALFLDDDVEPDDNIIVAYTNAIKQHPDSLGFVGLSKMPIDGRLWTDSIHVSSLYFWHIAEHCTEPVSWGVTANLLVKWTSSVSFDRRFPKTGGGEDIDLCIQLGHTLQPVKDAIIIHPWRDSVYKMMKRMFEWAIGDGMLNSKYPELCYRSLPNSVELSMIWAFVSFHTLWIPFVSQMLAHLVSNFIVHPIMHNGGLPSTILEKASFPRALLIVMFGEIGRISSDCGRLYGQITRYEFLRITSRFDWFIGRMPSDILNERIRSFSMYLFVCYFTLLLY